MKKRVITASIGGAIGIVLGVVISVQQNQSDNLIWISLACGVIAFVFGLLFEFRLG